MATSGWETLGNVLGGGIDRAGAFETGRLRTAQTESALQLARERQLSNVASEKKAKALDDAATAMAAAGIDPKQAQLLQNIALGGYGSDFSAGMTGLGKQQEMGFRDVLANPEAPLGEQFAAGQGVQGKVLPRYEVDGGVAQDLLGDEMGLFATPVGESTIRANDSLAQLRDTQRAAGGFSPGSGGGGAAGRDPLLGSTPAGMVKNPAYDPAKPIGEGNYPFLNGVQPVMGSREAGFFNRIYGSSGAVSQDTFNLSKFPFKTTSVGVLGVGKSAGPDVSMIDALAGNMKYAIADEDVRNYNVLLSGMNRALSFIEGQGLQGSNTLAQSYDALALRPGDTVENVMFKMAQTRQTVEQGLRPHLSSPRVPMEQKEDLRAILADLQRAVPFSVEDVIELRKAAQAGRAGASIGELAAQRMGNAPQPAAPTATPAAPGATMNVPPPRNDKGWELLEDAEGNLAYVSPDGRQIEEVPRDGF
jgi:hypothetical protein